LLEFSKEKKALKASPVRELKVELPQAGCRRQCGFGFIASDPGQVNNFARNTALLFQHSLHHLVFHPKLPPITFSNQLVMFFCHYAAASRPKTNH